ncbi:FAD binding domain protein [Thozetella sp. PMI_491]|nr:FAD binding domain protein [Thozetella sp. PMI_491]
MAASPAILLRESTDPATYQAAVWRRVFNLRRDDSRVPLAVCQARTTADVVAAVRLAKERGARVSVRSGGHSWAVWSVRHDAVLIDLQDLDVPEGQAPQQVAGPADEGRKTPPGRIDYDPKTKIVSCPPQTTGYWLNKHLATVDGGRAFAGGHCPDVGLGGFLLQGGMGWNCKNWGWACESIVGIDVVTAEAEELHLSPVENEELFWAARGAGPGFPAVVTRFYLHTRPLISMWQSLYFYPISEYRKVLQWEIDLCPTADPSIEAVAVSLCLPGGSEPLILANYLSFAPDEAAAQAALKPIHDSRPAGAKIESYCKPTDLPEQYRGQATNNPDGHRYCSENAYISNDADVVDVLEKAFTTVPNAKSCALYFAMNPTSRRPLADMALSMQTDHYFALYTVWEDAKDDASNNAWVHNIMKEVERRADGSYLGDSDFQHRRTKFWSDEAAAKLMQIRKKWDPQGRICGYLDAGDKSGIEGLRNEFEWQAGA